MKNIHLLPTNQPSKYVTNYMEQTMQWQNIYLTSDEEIKEGDWVIYNNDLQKSDGISFKSIDKKIILTTDQDLIKDGVQAIDKEFLEWFVKNPSYEKVEIIKGSFDLNPTETTLLRENYVPENTFDTYKIIIPKEESNLILVKEDCSCTDECMHYTTKQCKYLKEESKHISLVEKMKPLQEQWQKDMDKSLNPKQETLEEAAEIDLTNLCYYDKRNPDCSIDDEDIEDHKKSLLKKDKTCFCDNCFYGLTKLTEQLISQAERMYSEEEVIQFFEKYRENFSIHRNIQVLSSEFKQWFEQHKKK